MSPLRTLLLPNSKELLKRRARRNMSLKFDQVCQILRAIIYDLLRIYDVKSV
jgi:hypothetical protein